MTRGMDFRRKENTWPLRACFYASICKRFRTVHLTGWNGTAQERACILFLLLRCDGNYNCYDNKSKNVVIWKDKEYEYISSVK